MSELFIERAKVVHGDKYDYSKVEYVNTNKKVIIICPIHGDFEQIPKSHYKGHGCKKCANNNLSIMKTSNNEEFIKKAIQKHGDTYNYSKINYIHGRTKVIIICPIHGDFNQTPNDHLNGGCLKCGGKNCSNTEEFIKKVKQIHGDKYNYSKVNYVNANNNIIIICSIHGEFEQSPHSHLSGSGCNKCGIEKNRQLYVMTLSKFIERAKLKHNNKYDYSKVNYINMNTKIIIICPVHGNFLQSPWCHIKIGCGCQKCNYCGYSKSQILWLNFIATYNNIYIQHAENDGEYTIPTTKYKADGYCHETNTIYEYHGSYWHGDPNIYNKNEINKVNKKTFGELYANTQKKEQIIKNIGYNLVTMWESNWIKINISISILQNKFKEKYFTN